MLPFSGEAAGSSGAGAMSSAVELEFGGQLPDEEGEEAPLPTEGDSSDDEGIAGPEIGTPLSPIVS